MTWAWRSSINPCIIELLHNDAPVAEMWWLEDIDRPATVMDRIITGLNLPAAACAPSPAPVWELDISNRSAGAVWATYRHHGVEVMVVMWRLVPLRVDEMHQRILDALDPTATLPAVTPIVKADV